MKAPFIGTQDQNQKEKVLPLEIRTLHNTAVQDGLDRYLDPITGYEVQTRLAHSRRGICCGSDCRHCPYSPE